MRRRPASSVEEGIAMKTRVFVATAYVLVMSLSLLRGQDRQAGTYIISSQIADPVVHQNKDYYSLFMEAVCINQKETFWKKNVISVTANLEVNGKALDVPVYAERAREQDCRIAISHFGLLSWVPSRGNELKLGAKVLRFDNKDTIKRVLTGLTDSTQDPLLKTYAAAGIPYLSLIGAVGNTIYKAVGPDSQGEPLISFKGTTFSSGADPHDDFALKDTFVLEYLGTGQIVQSQLKFEDGDVKYNGQPLRSGAWILYRIQKFPRRKDYAGRPWHDHYQSAVRELMKEKPSQEAVDKDFSEGTTLLYADSDFTQDDQDTIYRDEKKAIGSMSALAKLGETKALAEAIESSTVRAVPLSQRLTFSPTVEVTISHGSTPTKSVEDVIRLDRLNEALARIERKAFPQ
jgi:hypothetical protein